jgi:site-specific recombinase XerD
MIQQTWEPTPLGPLLQAFFTEHLISHRLASRQTVDGYRDTFRLLLEFLQRTKGKAPSALCVSDLDAPAILEFLDYLEKERHNSVRSRNVRLAAIRAFFRLVALRDPVSVNLATRVLAIPVKRTDRRLVHYLTRPEMDAVLAAPDRTLRTGQRDYALLLTMYNSGARVSEIAALRRRHIQIGSMSFLEIHGKGRKERKVPIWPRTARTLKTWLETCSPSPESSAFPNARGGPLSRDGVNYILKAAVQTAATACPTLSGKRVSPHVIRHTTAMHLLESGVDIAVIALWLGHESIETTHGYLEADLKLKEKALQKLAPAGQAAPRFQADDPLLAFLKTL